MASACSGSLLTGIQFSVFLKGEGVTLSYTFYKTKKRAILEKK